MPKQNGAAGRLRGLKQDNWDRECHPDSLRLSHPEQLLPESRSR